MEEENKKLRAKERNEFNNTVRNLAAWVKKRDKRVLAHQAALEAEKEKQRELQVAFKALR